MSRSESPVSNRLLRPALAYAVLVLVTVGVFLLIRSFGETFGPAPAHPVAAAAGADMLLRVLVALTAVIVLGRLLAKVFAVINQPPVIGEVVAGILLGPSLLGPELSALVLPPAAAPFLGVIAQLGVVLYMFLVGLDLNPRLLAQSAHATIATSHAGIVIPFLFGCLLAVPLYPRLSSRDVSFTSFAVFMGVAMSITAFPVLARILTDYGLSQTKLGIAALSCAAVNDVTAWCLLALVTGVANGSMRRALLVGAGALLFVAAMFVLVRPALAWLFRRWNAENEIRTRITLTFVGLLLSAIGAEWVGIHAMFGAFLFGAVMPHGSDAARAIRLQLGDVVGILLLPAFFGLTGMRTRIDLLSDASSWLICGIIIAAATLGKFGGTFVVARLTGLSWNGAAMLGALMNTRGLMELIVLDIGLQLGIISPRLFAMMVAMALVTTMMTSPVLQLLRPRSRDTLSVPVPIET